MSFKKVRVEGVPLTLALAQKFAAMEPLPGEREKKPARTDFLLKHLYNKTFGGPSWAQGICRANERTYRLDGQHGSDLLSHLPEDLPFPEGLLVTIDTWEFDSVQDDAPPLFDMFNHPRSARSNEDAMGLYKARVPTLEEVSRRMLQKIANGIAEHQRGLKGGEVHPPRARGLYWRRDDLAQFACWVASYENTNNAGWIGRPGIVAEMLSDWLHDRELAREFWAYAFYESHPDQDHETRELARTYREWSIRKKYKTHDYRRKAATAWKHYLRESRAAA